jgi:hypothetical protein
MFCANRCSASIKKIFRGFPSTLVSDFVWIAVDDSQLYVSNSVLRELINVRDDSSVLLNRRFSLIDACNLIVCVCTY